MTRRPPLSPKRENQLVEQVRQGDRGALGELLGAYQRPIYHLCLRMVSNASDASELTQDAMMKVVEHIDDFRGSAKFSTWLYRIAMNLSISHLRKRKLRRHASLESAVGGDSPDQAAELKAMIADEREPGPDSRVETGEQIDRLMAAIDRLDETLRGVLLLRDLQEMDYAQIAEVMNVPVGTIKSRLFRARLALRQELAADAANPKPNAPTQRGAAE